MYGDEPKKPFVVIIGAGVAGCAAAGALQDYGIDFVVFDKHSRPGGLWADNYPGAKVQSTFELYEYPCKRFPARIRNRQDPPAPTADEVCTYLEDYIRDKDMASKFRFNTYVSDVLCTAEDNWIVEFDGLATKCFTYVIVCNGLVSSKPNHILLQGAEAFKNHGGKILHSSERRDDLVLEGKRVLVIGNGKSAVDAATAAATAATASGGTKMPIQLARRQTWYLPRYFFGCIQYKWMFHTRLGSAMLPRYYESSHPVLKLLHSLFTPLKWLLWRIMEVLLLLQFRLPMRLWPTMGTMESATLETSALVTDKEHLDRLRTGKVDMRIGSVQRLEANKAILSDGTEEPVDIIILATGWKLSYDQFLCADSIFAGLDFSKDGLDFSSDGLWLYRNVLPAGFKGMAFVGSNTLTFMNIFTAYIQAYWLAELLAGVRPWPDETHMKETIEREKVYKRQYYKASEMRGASVESYMQHYHDVLMREMVHSRPAFHCCVRPVAHWLVPILPKTLQGCLEPLDVAAKPASVNESVTEATNSIRGSRSKRPNNDQDKGSSSTSSNEEEEEESSSSSRRLFFAARFKRGGASATSETNGVSHKSSSLSDDGDSGSCGSSSVAQRFNMNFQDEL
ncbi:monooxygenase [N-oxide-forming] 2 [Seminavis robusta]|uniref:Monooxygenase [N-oxide-forming] 2 n=1 Tax=Seminavis robusta TaxID=568900 RepID=A0A9N8E2Z1_9STRA|nr:monooxygenase [N-oxide-forming] 2 [Seminavis robusta]|eukprot:Sro451_g145680.1 monooxygenase [N-oxide-forming] 2 (622) ;mRNA; r:21831-23816